MKLASQYVKEGGLDYAKTLLRDALDPKMAEKMIQQIQTQVQKTPFAFLQKAGSENLLTFFQDEHPQTIALIVSHLPHHKASEILGGLPVAGLDQGEYFRDFRHAKDNKRSTSENPVESGNTGGTFGRLGPLCRTKTPRTQRAAL